jgi:hypothetical protein
MPDVAFRFQDNARRRAALAIALGLSVVLMFGPLLLLPAIAFVALVYYAHQVAAVLAGDERVAHPDLAVVIVLNASVVLLVQLVVFVQGFGRAA